VFCERFEFSFESGQCSLSAEGFVVSEKGNDGVCAQVGKPLVRSRKKTFPEVRVEIWVELGSAGECPLGGTRWVRSKSRGITGAAHVSNNETLGWKPKMELRLEASDEEISLREPVANERNALTVIRYLRNLRAGRRRNGRFVHGCVRGVGGRRALEH
jgi:hypothetical protein